jgi:hypothetical protein
MLQNFSKRFNFSAPFNAYLSGEGKVIAVVRSRFWFCAESTASIHDESNFSTINRTDQITFAPLSHKSPPFFASPEASGAGLAIFLNNTGKKISRVSSFHPDFALIQLKGKKPVCRLNGVSVFNLLEI